MGFITKYGSFWGQLPVTSGNIYWLAPAATYTVEGRSYPASASNDGLSPERAIYSTNSINLVMDLVSANAGDVVVLLPGDYSFASQQTVDVAGVTITGLPRGSATGLADHGAGFLRHAASITSSAAGTTLAITANNTEVAFLHVIPVTAQAGIDVQGTNINLHDLTFDMRTPAESTSTFGVSITGATSLLRVANCFVASDGSQGGWFDDSGGTDAITLARSVIENNTILLDGTSAWADVIVVASGATGLIIRDNDFYNISGAIMTDVVDITGNTTDYGVMMVRNIVPVGSDGVQATATSDVQLALNYIATIEGGTGGTLVS